MQLNYLLTMLLGMKPFVHWSALVKYQKWRAYQHFVSSVFWTSKKETQPPPCHPCSTKCLVFSEPFNDTFKWARLMQNCLALSSVCQFEMGSKCLASECEQIPKEWQIIVKFLLHKLQHVWMNLRPKSETKKWAQKSQGFIPYFKLRMIS